MNHVIINQLGKYIQGKEYDEVVFAIDNDRITLTIDGKQLEIIEHRVDSDGNKQTVVKVDI